MKLTSTRNIVAIGALLAATLLFASPRPSAQAATKRSVTIVAYDSFTPSKAIFDPFTKKTGITVKVVTAGDGGALVNKAILTKGEPLGDVLWGVDNTFLSRALKAAIFDPYHSSAPLDAALRKLVPHDEVTPVDYGDVCVNYDRARTPNPPTSLEDLAKPAFARELVVESPATSSTGLAFMLGTIAHFGESRWRTYWAQLKTGGVKVVDGWDAAYNTEFSGSGGRGKRALVVSYGSSPPAAVIFGKDPKAKVSPIGVVASTCFRQVEFAGVLRNSKHTAEARAVIDYLVGPEFQADLPLSLFVFPARTGVAWPEAFRRFAIAPTTPLRMSPAEIAAGRDRWIDEWSKTVEG